MKARILLIRRILLGLVVVFAFSTTLHTSFAETIDAKADFSKKDITALVTTNSKSDLHEYFEYNLEWIFQRAPYITIKHIENKYGINKSAEGFSPNFEVMEEKRYNYLVHYNLERSGDNVTISYTLYDGLFQNSILSNSLTAPVREIQKLTGNIAHDIFTRITGEFGFFIGKAFYTERSKNTGFQVVYSQAFNQRRTQYTDEKTMVTSPTYCDGGRKIYLSERQKYTMTISETDSRTGVKSFIKGLSNGLGEKSLSSPEIASDCSKILFVASEGGGAAIYMHNLKTKITTQVLKDGSLNTRPIFSNNNPNLIYYISNKVGSTKIFKKYISSQSGTMISRGLGSYIYLSLSPDETKIAFVKVFGGKFYLGVMKANGSGETLLKEGYIIEAPSWTPTGTNVIASFQLDKSGIRRIYSVSTVTGYAYPLKISQGNIVQANWLVDSNDYIQKNSN